MPALVSHYLFCKTVKSKLEKAGVNIPDYDSMLIGAQGPDLFFFHRIMPWHFSPKSAKQFVNTGRAMHRMSPVILFDELKKSVLNHSRPSKNGKPPVPNKYMLSYMQGFLCHYALDRAAHPYIYSTQKKLWQHDPGYGDNLPYQKVKSQYHFRLESALDTMTLRRQTGVLMEDFHLLSAVPKASKTARVSIGMLYTPVFKELFDIDTDPYQIEKAPLDMRQVLVMINDPRQIRSKSVNVLESLINRGHIVTSLLRPTNTGDWDYANLQKNTWENPFSPNIRSNYSYFDIYDVAASEAATMILEFTKSLSNGLSMEVITQDRGFYTDIPEVYQQEDIL